MNISCAMKPLKEFVKPCKTPKKCSIKPVFIEKSQQKNLFIQLGTRVWNKFFIVWRIRVIKTSWNIKLDRQNCVVFLSHIRLTEIWHLSENLYCNLIVSIKPNLSYNFVLLFRVLLPCDIKTFDVQTHYTRDSRFKNNIK